MSRYLHINIYCFLALILMLATNAFAKKHNSEDIEKIYLHTNDKFFLIGETLLFKAYCVNQKNQLSKLSGAAYIELLDSENKVVSQAKIKLEKGSGFGDIFLASTLNSGKYRLIAYTRWMKNFGEESFFSTEITIINPFKPLENTSEASQNPDIQFFPEGGNLVAGMENTIAFKVVNSENQGINFSGKILNDSNQVVAEFKPLVHGIGRFSFVPDAARKYTAIIADSLDNFYFKELPKALTEGYVLALSETSGKFSITVKRNGKNDDGMYLLIQNRQSEIKKNIYFNEGLVELSIDKKDLPPGISVVTLFSQNGIPVRERLVFNEMGIDNNTSSVSTDKKDYFTRERVVTKIKFDNLEGTDLTDISVSARKFNQQLPQNPESIFSYLFLSSELKGAVENPEYYLSASTSSFKRREIDNLLLTHGWRSYKQNQMEYLPEMRGEIITGRVLDKSNNPVAGIMVYLSIPSKNYIFRISKTNQQGAFLFNLDEIDVEKDMILQVEKSSEHSLELEDDFFKFSISETNEGIGVKPSLEKSLINRMVNSQVENAYYEQKKDVYLERPLKTDFYGTADFSYKLDDYTRFVVMEEVLREYIPGVQVRKKNKSFYFKVIDYDRGHPFQGRPLIIIDGVPVFNADEIMAYDPLKVETIDVIGRKYYYGPHIFDGIVSFKTYDGNLPEFKLAATALKLKKKEVMPEKIYYSPAYDENNLNNRIPDFRTQLYWEPKVFVEKEEPEFVFYTGDDTGTYEVVVEGISSDGKMVSTKCYFEVKEKAAP